MHSLWITSHFPLGATRPAESYISHWKANGRTSDQSAMTRRTAREPEDNRDEQFVFRKKRKMISRLMIGENPKRNGASPTGPDGRRSSGDWTSFGLETEAGKRKPNRGKPPAINGLDRKPDAEQAAAGIARGQQPQQRRSGSLSSDKLPFFLAETVTPLLRAAARTCPDRPLFCRIITASLIMATHLA